MIRPGVGTGGIAGTDGTAGITGVPASISTLVLVSAIPGAGAARGALMPGILPGASTAGILPGVGMTGAGTAGIIPTHGAAVFTAHLPGATASPTIPLIT